LQVSFSGFEENKKIYIYEYLKASSSLSDDDDHVDDYAFAKQQT
jgi:hypothetical protein